jgi:hypothetical protein
VHETAVAKPSCVGKPLRFELEGFGRRGPVPRDLSIHEEEVLVGVLRISHRAGAYS